MGEQERKEEKQPLFPDKGGLFVTIVSMICAWGALIALEFCAYSVPGPILGSMPFKLAQVFVRIAAVVLLAHFIRTLLRRRNK